MEIKMKIRRIYAFLRCLPVFYKGILDLWEMLKEIYNKETMNEIKKTAEETIKNKDEK